MINILKKVDLIILSIIALVAGILAILDVFNVIDIAQPYYSLITLFLLAMIGLHLITSHLVQDDFRKKSDELLSQITKGLEETDFILFDDSMEIERDLGNRMLEAKKSVCDLTWKIKISEGFSASDRQLSHEFMDKCIATASDRISYREIFIFNDSRRIEKLNRRLDENKNGYSCRYFKEDSIIPRLQFVIVDDEEVYFFASSADAILCSFRNKDLCKVFRSYYEAVWGAATVIKEGPRIEYTQVELIRKKLKSFR